MERAPEKALFLRFSANRIVKNVRNLRGACWNELIVALMAKKGETKSQTTAARQGDVSSSPRSSEEQVKAMKATGEQYAMETAEDYLKAISDLIEQTGKARVVDLASRLGISHPTVIQTVWRFQQGGFVTSEPYRSIVLTD